MAVQNKRFYVVFEVASPRDLSGLTPEAVAEWIHREMNTDPKIVEVRPTVYGDMATLVAEMTEHAGPFRAPVGGAPAPAPKPAPEQGIESSIRRLFGL